MRGCSGTISGLLKGGGGRCAPQTEPDASSRTRRRVQFRPGPVGVEDALHDRQAQTCSSVPAARSPVGLPESRKEKASRVLRYARTPVPDRHFGLRGIGALRDLSSDGSALLRKLHGVRNQVEKNPPDAFIVGVNVQARRQPKLDRQVLLIHLRLEIRQDEPDESGQVEVRRPRRVRMGFDPLEFQKLQDEFLQPPDIPYRDGEPVFLFLRQRAETALEDRFVVALNGDEWSLELVRDVRHELALELVDLLQFAVRGGKVFQMAPLLVEQVRDLSVLLRVDGPD